MIKRPQARLLLAGGGEELSRLQQASKGLDIHFPGYVEGEEKAAIFREADAFVLPSLKEPWGWVINEAMSVALPILCSEPVGARDLIQGNGFLIDPKDVEGMAEKIRILIDNPDMAATMGERSLDIITGYQIDKVAKYLGEVSRKFLFEV